jgi:hypothetical protein
VLVHSKLYRLTLHNFQQTLKRKIKHANNPSLTKQQPKNDSKHSKKQRKTYQKLAKKR